MKKITLIIIAAFFLLTGCEKFLDVQPKDLKIPQTVKDYQDLMNGEGWSKTIGGTTSMEFYWMEMLTDDISEVTATTAIPSDSKKHFSSFYVWRNNYDFAYIENGETNYNYETWTWLYRVVNISNIILADLDKATGLENEKDLLRAEAYFSRAMAYYYLVNIWGEPYDETTASGAMGIPVKNTPYPELTSIPRNTVREVYTQIVSDLAMADSMMKKPDVSATGNIFHVTKESIYILTSRVYLYMQNWQKAKEFADKAITLRPALYDISTETFQVFANSSFFNPRNKEIVFSYHRSDKPQFGTPPYCIFGSSSTSGVYLMSPELVALYTTNDNRKNAFLSSLSTRPGVYFAKTMLQESGSVLFDYNIRVAEAYLNRAEAAAQLGDLASAASDINTLRSKRILNVTPVSFSDKTQALNFTYAERRRELVFQGHRWFDLRRTGRPSITHYYTPVNGTGPGATLGTPLKFILQSNDPGYTLELPYKETNLNPALTPIGLPDRLPQ